MGDVCACLCLWLIGVGMNSPKVTELNVMDEVIVEDIGSLPWK